MKHIEYRAPIQTIYVLLYLHIQKRCTELIDPRRLHKIRFVPIVRTQTHTIFHLNKANLKPKRTKAPFRRHYVYFWLVSTLKSAEYYSSPQIAPAGANCPTRVSIDAAESERTRVSAGH